MKSDRDILAEALAQLKNEGRAGQPPKAVVDETLRRLAEAGGTGREPAAGGRGNPGRTTLRTTILRFSLAAAALIVLGYSIGRTSRPARLDLDELREALAPSIAASIEPALRARLVEDMHQRYQVALGAAYLKVKEELTEQYRDDLNRFAVQLLAASNAATNRLLTELVESIDTAQTEDLNRIARVLYQIEQNRIQDKTQLATGLHVLASRTEDELQQLAQVLVASRPQDFDERTDRPIRVPHERNEP